MIFFPFKSYLIKGGGMGAQFTDQELPRFSLIINFSTEFMLFSHVRGDNTIFVSLRRLPGTQAR